MKYPIFTAAAVALLLSSTASFAATDAKSFIEKATVGNMFEVESSRIALERSQNPEVKNFAQKMVDDHAMVGSQMNAALTPEQKTLAPAALDNEHENMLKELREADAADFDKEYIEAQKEAHEDAVALFKDFAEEGEDANLKNFAAQKLPELREHRDQINAMDESMKGK